MRFREALKRAGLSNPGRTTWCGVATDGTAVFTIWAHDIRCIDGRFFAWWDHNNTKPETGEGMSKTQKGHTRAFVRLAAKNLGKTCRAVIVHRKPRSWEVSSAEYPNPQWARAEFRAVENDALQFIVELLSPIDEELSGEGLSDERSNIRLQPTAAARGIVRPLRLKRRR